MPKTRSIIFYDQIGCGRSTFPEPQEQSHSIEHSVQDLDTLIIALRLSKFHLFGHSFGGILAYEYLKSKKVHISSTPSPSCLSLILANTPSNMRISLEESSRIKEEIKHELIHDMSSLEVDESIKDKSLSKSIKELLHNRHECRTRSTPEPLAKAIRRRGKIEPEAVSDYVALPYTISQTSSVEHSNKYLPPVLLIRGEFDFVTEECIEGWRKIFEGSPVRGSAYREEVMKNCAHYCHLEEELQFSELVKGHMFIHDY
jgi:proline-specific peptidase